MFRIYRTYCYIMMKAHFCAWLTYVMSSNYKTRYNFFGISIFLTSFQTGCQ